MANISPLDVPEIRILVSRFLTHTDLVCCLQVCKVWRSSYLPLIWSKASLRQDGLNPTKDSLSHQRELVKDLSYDFGVGPECLSIEFPNLKRLEVRSKFRTQLWRFPCGLSNLRELRLEGLEFTAEDTTTFWNLCTQLESLRADKLVVAHLSEKSVAFDRLVNLSLRVGDRASRAQRIEWMEWINQCRNIVVLDLYHHCRVPSVTHDFAMRFATGTWPKMQELRLQFFRMSDKDLARVIEGMHRATTLDIRAGQFEELSLAALRCHYPYLRHLHICMCGSIPVSRMVAEVMASCPQLQSLASSHARSQDIVNSPPWICGRYSPSGEYAQ
jgi:hypothetical protein